MSGRWSVLGRGLGYHRRFQSRDAHPLPGTLTSWSGYGGVRAGLGCDQAVPLEPESHIGTTPASVPHLAGLHIGILERFVPHLPIGLRPSFA